jgi:hypothetical protein
MLPLVEGVMVDYHSKKNISPSTKGSMFIILQHYTCCYNILIPFTRSEWANSIPIKAGIIDTVKYGVPRVVYILSLFKVQPFAGIIDTVKYGVPRVVYIFSLFKVQPFAGIIDTVKYGVPRVVYIVSNLYISQHSLPENGSQTNLKHRALHKSL